MRSLLLDTHALLWMAVDDPRFARSARRQVDSATSVSFSVASLWEIGLKLSGRKLDVQLPDDWHIVLPQVMRETGVEKIDVRSGHCRRVQDLPWHHKDPFDRMLVAQAQVEGLAILTADRRLRDYDVQVIW